MPSRYALIAGLLAVASQSGAADVPQCLSEFKAEEARIVREAGRAATANPPGGDLKAQQQIVQAVHAALEAAAKRADDCNRRSRPAISQDAIARMNQCALKADQEMDALQRAYNKIQNPSFAEQTAMRNEGSRVSDQRMACMKKAQ